MSGGLWFLGGGGAGAGAGGGETVSVEAFLGAGNGPTSEVIAAILPLMLSLRATFCRSLSTSS